MKFLPVPIALLLSAAAGAAMTGAAFPPRAEPPPAELRLIPVGGCHADVRNHYVPEFDGTLRHVHRDDCRPVPVERRSGDKPVDCHRDIRTHRIDGVMLRHRHVGKNCTVRIARQVN